MKAWHDQWGRVNVANLTKQELVEQTHSCISMYENLIEKMLNISTPRTWNNTYHVLEVAISGVEAFDSAVSFSKEIGRFSLKDPEYIEAKNQIKTFFNKLYTSRRVSLALHNLKNTAKLSPYRQYILESAILSYTEGFHSLKKRLKSQKIDMELDKYEAQFLDNIHQARKNLYITFADLTALETIPEHMKKAGLEKAQSLGLEGYAFNLENGNYTELMSHCKSREMRKNIYQYYVKLASSTKLNNEETLKNLIRWRTKKAKISGYENYTNYATSNAGLNGEGTVLSFLDNMKEHFEEDMKTHRDLLKAYAREKHGLTSVKTWDRPFIKKEVKEYLENYYDIKYITINLDLALKEMFGIAKKMFGLHFEVEKSQNYQSWDENAVCYKISNKEGQVVSHLVFDIYQRDEKPDGLIYNYTLNPTLKVGKRVVPSQQAIVMHLKRNNGVAHLSLSDTVTLYHEFGHALHLLLTQKKYHQHHPFAIESDAIEFPSQLFERFAQSSKILTKIAFQNNELISKEKAEKWLEVEKFNRPQQYWTHILESKVDIYLNTRFKPQGMKSFHEVLSPVFNEYEQRLNKYNKFQNNQFEHFFMGSVYYGYLWAEHMVELWNDAHGNKPLSEQGTILIELLNQAAEKPFNEQFKKLVTDPYEAEIKFEKMSNMLNELMKQSTELPHDKGHKMH